MNDTVTDDTEDGGTSRSAQRVFNALASAPRRKILAYLSASSLTAGEIAARFDMTKPSVSQHLSILEEAGLVTRKKRGQFVHYALVPNNLVNTLTGFVQEVCPIGRPLKKESRAKVARRKTGVADSVQMSMLLAQSDED